MAEPTVESLLDLIQRMYDNRGNCCGCHQPWEGKYDSDLGERVGGVTNEEIEAVLAHRRTTAE